MDTLASNLDSVFTGYKTWLDKQPLSLSTRRTYLTQVRQFCFYLQSFLAGYGDPLTDFHARDYAVRDYKTYLKTVRKRKPNTINIALAAIDHFYRFLKMEVAQVKREDLPTLAPKALEPEDQKRLLRAIERCASVRDKAVARLLFYTGLRVGECSALNLDDVLMSARKGMVIIRSGKGDLYREVPLNGEVQDALKTWLKDRHERFTNNENPAFFLNRQGIRLSTRAIDLIIRKFGEDTGLALSAHILRHTCLTNLVRKGHDLVLVAEIAGHRRLETTRRYSLPTEEDRAAAMESLSIEY